MPTHHAQCDPDLLRRSLHDGLSEIEQQRLEHHLSTCEDCCRQMEQLAGEAQDWSSIASALRRPAINDDALSQAGADEVTSDYQGSPADFAVDFLDPPKVADSLGNLNAISIREVIGHGGMGIVLKGFEAELNRTVAVKVLAPHLATSGAARQRFAREAQAAAAVVHPNVMPIHTVDSTGKLPYLVMPFIAGESLQQRIARRGALEVIDVLRIAMQVAQGLAAAHAQGLVHRDVKPANILLERGVDRALLTDFGLARAADDATLTRTGVIAGTPQFMSPEQARGDVIDARSDLFSLGSVMYCMTTGRPPFLADSSYGILRRITDNPPWPILDLNPQAPKWLVRLIDRLLEKDVTRRLQSAQHTSQLLEQCLAHVQQPAAVSLTDEVDRRRIRGQLPNRGRIAGVLAIAFATVAFTLLAQQWLDRRASTTGNDRQATLGTPSTPPDTAHSQLDVSGSHDDATTSSELNIGGQPTQTDGLASEVVEVVDASPPPPLDDMWRDLEQLSIEIDQLESELDDVWNATPSLSGDWNNENEE